MKTGSSGSGNMYVKQYEAQRTREQQHRRKNEPAADAPPPKNSAKTDFVEISPSARQKAEESSKTTSTEVSTTITVTTEDEAAKGVVGGDITKRADREATGDYYDSVLKGLREQYGEKEALSRFDEFMRAEGFELVPTQRDDGAMPFGANAFGDIWHVSFATLPMGNFLSDNDMFGARAGNSLQLHSSLTGVATGEGVQYNAYSDATYRVETNAAEKTFLKDLKDERLAAFSGTTDIDLDAYLRAGNSSVTGVSTELAADLGRFFEEQGINFSGDDMMNIRLVQDENGEFTGLVATASIADRPDGFPLLRQFGADEMGEELFGKLVDMYNSAEFTDASGLAFDDDGRSVAVRQTRSFSFRAIEPSAVVMHDEISFDKTGYVYQKRVADAFAPEADTVQAITQKTADTTISAEELEKTMQDAMLEAKNNGGLVKGTITDEEYASMKSDLSGHSSYAARLRLPEGYGRKFENLQSISSIPLTVMIYDGKEWVPQDSGTQIPDEPEPEPETAEETKTAEPVDAGKTRTESARERINNFVQSLRARGNNHDADMLSGFFEMLQRWQNRSK